MEYPGISGIDFGSSPEVHETDEDFEQLVYSLVGMDDLAAEPLLERIREGVWRSLAGNGAQRPVILTATRCRLLLRRAIEFELPAVYVLARAEIPASVDVRAGTPVTCSHEAP